MKNLFYYSAALIVAITMLASCSDNSVDGNSAKISSHNASESHNMGKNCMTCHKDGGPGDGWFSVAGTVYDSSFAATMANATIKLFTGSDGTGTVKITIDGDSKGNFFTTQTLTFGSGLYPVVYSQNGNVKYMGEAITMGQCNSCHGVTTDKIWVN